MRRRPPRFKRTGTLFPSTTLVRARSGAGRHRHGQRPRLRRVAHAEVRAALVADLQRDLAAVGRLHRPAAGQALAAGLDVAEELVLVRLAARTVAFAQAAAVAGTGPGTVQVQVPAACAHPPPPPAPPPRPP